MTLTVWNTHRYSTPNNTNSLNTFMHLKDQMNINILLFNVRCVSDDVYSCILLIFRPYVKF